MKAFANFAVLPASAKVLSANFSAQGLGDRVGFSKMRKFYRIRESFHPRKFPAIRYYGRQLITCTYISLILTVVTLLGCFTGALLYGVVEPSLRRHITSKSHSHMVKSIWYDLLQTLSQYVCTSLICAHVQHACGKMKYSWQ